MGEQAVGLLSASELVRKLRDREISSRELLSHFGERRAAYNDALNAIVTVDDEAAQTVAAAADEQLAGGDDDLPPLLGLPMTIKDAIATKGMRSTGGAVELADHVPDADAQVVSRIRQAGGVIFGKTNLPRWSADVQSYNEVFGTTNNPWDLTCGPGGSSGGAAAAVCHGSDRRRDRHGHRRVDSVTGSLLRGVRTQAELRGRSPARLHQPHHLSNRRTRCERAWSYRTVGR